MFGRSKYGNEYEDYLKNLPEDIDSFSDKYFLRSRDILQDSNLNPWVLAQVFIRKEAEIFGINEALAVLFKYADVEKNKIKIWAVRERERVNGMEPFLLILAPVQSIIVLETIYLGILSFEITRHYKCTNIDIKYPDLNQIYQKTFDIKQIIGGRPITYGGARHWSFRYDQMISRAAFEGGAVKASTDAGAATFGREGVGTIPHILETVIHYKYGAENAVSMATAFFDLCMPREIPRVALVDYRNMEITDSLRTIEKLRNQGGRLDFVRVDTCGENVMQNMGYLDFSDYQIEPNNIPYWFGNGVSVSGVYALRKKLDKTGNQGVKIILSSGFADVKKVNAFVEAEKKLKVRLFDELLIGGLFDSITTSMDVVKVGDDPKHMTPISKVGRYYRGMSEKLIRVI